MDRTPEVRLEGFSGGVLQGFTSGMGNTFAGCFQAFGQGACTNSACGAAVLFLLGTCGTLSVVGGIVGAFTTDASNNKRAAQSGIDRVLNTTPAQLELRDQVVVTARRHGKTLAKVDLATSVTGAYDFGVIQSLGIDTVLEVSLTRVGTAGPGGGAPSQLYMEARTRLIRVADKAEIAAREVSVSGHSYAAWEWQANRGELLREGFQNAYERLAEKIYDAHLRP